MDDEQYAAYTFVPSDPELALALDSAAKMAREADNKFCAAFGGDGETSAFWLTAAVGEIRAALSRQALRAPAPSEAVAWRDILRIADAIEASDIGQHAQRTGSICHALREAVEQGAKYAAQHPAPARGVTEADWTAASKPLCVTGDNNEAVLQVMLDGDGDVHLKLTPTDLNVRQSLGVGVEFCTKAGGGRNMAVTKAAREFVFALNRAALTPDAP